MLSSLRPPCRPPHARLLRAEAAARGSQQAPLSDFTRWVPGPEEAQLQTSVVSLSKPAPLWRLWDRTPTRVDLVSAVHVGDLEYYRGLQQMLSTHERVLYELVADTSKVKAGVRWRPPPPSGASGAGGRRGRGGWVASLQRTVASALGLTFQLENLDYSGDTWFHADMTLQNFRAAQAKAKETLFGFVARLSQHAAALDGALSPRSSAQEEVHPAAKAARFLPMPLLLYLILYTVGATASASTLSASCPGVPPRPALADSPVARAVLGFDFGAAAKLLMGAALCDEALAAALSGEAAASSVLLGGRNGAAVDTLEAAMEEGVSSIAILYGSAHLPDLEKRLLRLGFSRSGPIAWLPAWRVAVPAQRAERVGSVAGWGLSPPSATQAAALALLSLVLAGDLALWEVVARWASAAISGEVG